jgi:hypothetical protein
MKNTFKNYEAAGPLCYLLMDNDGNMQLGLYKKAFFKSLVLIIKYKTEYFVIDPPEKLMDAFFRDEISLIDLVFYVDGLYITDIENNPLSNEKATLIYNYISSQMSGTLSKQLFFTTYPNYYYFYREMFELFNN